MGLAYFVIPERDDGTCEYRPEKLLNQLKIKIKPLAKVPRFTWQNIKLPVLPIYTVFLFYLTCTLYKIYSDMCKLIW